MDFGYSVENERLREEVRAFIRDTITPELQEEVRNRPDGAKFGPLQQALNEKIAEKGWIGMSWPPEYGGRGADRVDQFVVEKELVWGEVPLANFNNFAEQAPAIIANGTDEQKKYFIPGIVSGDVTLALGYTEPSAGTDLASLQTRAVEDGDDYVINGQKMYTTGAHNCTHIYLMVRTDPDAPKHAGISIFLVPMDTPGITVRPLYTLTGHRTNEVFFEDVRVSKTAMLGEKNRGWYFGSVALNLGRSGAGRYHGYVKSFETIAEMVKKDAQGDRVLADDPAVQDTLAELYTDAQVCRLMTLRTLSMFRRGLAPTYEASAEKVWGPEFGVRSTIKISQILGPYAQLWEGSDLAPEGGEFPRSYVSAMVATFAHGGVQVMRDAIVRRGFQFPR